MIRQVARSQILKPWAARRRGTLWAGGFTVLDLVFRQTEPADEHGLTVRRGQKQRQKQRAAPRAAPYPNGRESARYYIIPFLTERTFQICSFVTEDSAHDLRSLARA